MVLTGTTGNDTMEGTTGAETLQGSGGNDSIRGYAGNDSYLFQGGDGNDTIVDTSGTNNILFAAGITTGDLRLFRGTGQNKDLLYVYYGGGSDRITLASQFNASTNVNNGYFDKIVLADTSQIDLTNNLTLTGTSGNDTLYGSTGAETLTGGTGADTIYGYAGNDSYFYQDGDGNDLIDDTGGTNALRFASGITSGDIRLIRGTGASNDDLFVFYGASGHKITINGQFNASTHVNNGDIDKYILADTSEISLSSNLTLTGTSSAESVNGSSAADTLVGLGGNDNLSAYGGDDVLNGGAGHDTMSGSTGNDTIVFDQSASGNDDHITDFKTSGTDKIALSDAVFVFNSGDGSKDGVSLTDNTDIYDVGTNFTGGSFSGAPGTGNGCTFLFDTTDKQLWYDADGNGGGTAVLIGVIDNSYTYAASDFIGAV